MLVGVIGDEDLVAGFLLAGVGQRDVEQSNYLVVDRETTATADIDKAFKELTQRKDVGVVLIAQAAAERIRAVVGAYDGKIPTVLEIPSKESAYDPAKDKVMARVSQLLGRD